MEEAARRHQIQTIAQVLAMDTHMASTLRSNAARDPGSSPGGASKAHDLFLTMGSQVVRVSRGLIE